MTEADELRPAATVVVLRDGTDGLEVLMLKRSSRLAFYGGAWVFPGGRIDPGDRLEGDAVGGKRAAARAAVRETLEEAGLTLDPTELVHFAQWITPPGRTRRFDTWFFAAHAPDGNVRIDGQEVDAHRWLRPADALDSHRKGEIELPPPTFVTLWQLRPIGTAEAAYADLSARPAERYEPRPLRVDIGMVFLYEDDAGYAERDPEAPGARHRITAQGNDWHYERDDQ